MNYFTAFLAALLIFSHQLVAQCPVILNCPTAIDTFCILEPNNTELWVGSPFLDPINSIDDLAEGLADLNISVLDTCANAAIRYLLFLDLDGNGSLETVINSDDLPPVGIVNFNNADNPGYSGGTAQAFDARAVAADEKYRFTLEQTQSGDTTHAKVRWANDAQPGTFVPQLPIGKHKIVWLIESPTGTDTCASDFVMRDCQAPVVTCLTDLSVNLLPSGMITIWTVDFISTISDNVTPSNMLESAIRRSGDGDGFPLNESGFPNNSLTFNCCDIGTQWVEIWARDKAGNVSYCSTSIDVMDAMGICSPCDETTIIVCGKTFWDNAAFENVTFTYSYGVLSFQDSTSSNCANFVTHADIGQAYTITAEKDDNPLNGVSTFDLVLISKHILGLETLDEPWKMLAADANKNGAITSFDVVELRKLILGIYNKLPNADSWYFIPSDFVFPIPANPFSSPVPSTIVGVIDNNLNIEHTFLGYKMGDVNATALPNSLVPSAEDRALALLSFSDEALRAGETAEINLQTVESHQWLGLQLGIQFDPEKIEIEYVASGNLPNFDENAWAQPRPGLLNISWFETIPYSVLPRENLLTLHVRALTTARLSEVVSLSTERLSPEAYNADNSVVGLQLVHREWPAQPNNRAEIYAPQPNPTTAGASIPLRLSFPQPVMLQVMDFSGKMMFQNEIHLASGAHVVEIPASALPVPGVYVWRASAGEVMRTGKIARQ